MKAGECTTLVFSSSAAVYGQAEIVPITENIKLSPLNPYARTKMFIEDILRDISESDNTWKIIILRYFNPIGAHQSGKLCEKYQDKANNLMSYILDVAIGNLNNLTIFGNDYDTPDGTCIRDYIHVMDLANGHSMAVDKLIQSKNKVFIILNLGTGKGYSVLDIIKTMSNVVGKEIPYTFGPKREGDSATCYSDSEMAFNILNWKANKTIEDMCIDNLRSIQYNLHH